MFFAFILPLVIDREMNFCTNPFLVGLLETSNEDDITVRLLGILNCNNSLRTCVEQGLAAEKTMVGCSFPRCLKMTPEIELL